MTVREIRIINKQIWFNITTIQNKKIYLIERGFDHRTSGLWAHARFHCATLLHNKLEPDLTHPAIRSSTSIYHDVSIFCERK